MVEFDHFRKSTGLPSFVLSASEWIDRTNAIKHLIPAEVTQAQASIIYANEADVFTG